MVKALPVVAAIPNFNMGDSLRNLIPQVLAQGYDRVFVLDDASADNTVDVVADFGDEVTLVRSPENRGAGANRNQIIDQVDDGAIIHFIDADMDLETAGIPTVARELFERYADRGVGLIGGLVSRNDGSQEPFNYGAVFSVWGTLSGALRRRGSFPGQAAAGGRYAPRWWHRSPRIGRTYLLPPLQPLPIGCTRATCWSTPRYSGRSAATTHAAVARSAGSRNTFGKDGRQAAIRSEYQRHSSPH